MQEQEKLSGERQSLIESRLVSEGRVLAAQLAAEFGVSIDTIRRDLRELASEGRCRRVYGGALPPAPRPGNHQERLSFWPERKQALARAAVSVIKPGMTVFVDAGTTNLAVMGAIESGMPLTVVTNAPAIAAYVLDRPEWRLIQIGGEVDLTIGAAVGAMAIRNLSGLLPDLAILGTCGFDPVAGLTAHTLEESELKQVAASRSKEVMAVLTEDKLQTRAPYGFLQTADCGYLVFEAGVSQDVIAETEKSGVNVIIAEPSS